MGKASARIPADRLELYEKLVATRAGVERKGARRTAGKGPSPEATSGTCVEETD